MSSFLSVRAALLGAAIALVAPCQAWAGPALPPPPVFPKGATVDTIQGQTIADPWRALENADDPAVQAWSDAQNARARAWLDALPGRAAITARIRALISATSPGWYGLQARPDAIFALYFDPARQQPMLITLAPSADPATRRVLLDPNLMDGAGGVKGSVAIDWFRASPDGSKVAVSLSVGGSEDGTLHVIETATGKEIEAPIPAVQFPTAGGSLAWAADGKGFWYTRYPGADAPEAERHFNQQAYWHALGTPAARDPLVLGQADGLPRTAEVFLNNEESGPLALASVQLGDGGQWQHFVLGRGGNPAAPALRIGAYADRVVGGAVIDHDGTVYGVSRLGAPKGRIVRLAAPYTGGLAAASVIVPERADGAVIDGGEFQSPLTLTNGHLLVSRIAGGPSLVTAYDRDGGHGRDLAIPPFSAVNALTALPGGDVLADVTSYTSPPQFVRWSATSGAVAPTLLRQTSPTHYNDATVTRLFAVSKDGTRVPVTVIAKKGIALDGSHPLLLNAYGGYGINITPAFSTWRTRLWLDAGGIYAVANLRGGGEYGQTWHEQGMLTAKQNVFDDMTAAAQTLIRAGYTAPAHLAMLGGSNGGLLMGAMITQHPALMRAVVSEVGIYDMIRVELDPNGAFNVSEFGTVKDPAQFRALQAYSPYHHVVPGTAYPAVLLTTGANDGRVNPLHSRKFAAALQDASTSGLPVLLRTSRNAGHGIGSSLDETIALGTDTLMFLIDQLGMDASRAAR